MTDEELDAAIGEAYAAEMTARIRALADDDLQYLLDLDAAGRHELFSAEVDRLLGRFGP